MLTYASIYLLIITNCLFGGREFRRDINQILIFNFRYVFIFIILLIFLGFRKEIGVDWKNYENIYISTRNGAAYESPLFYLLAYLIVKLEISWYYINFLSSLIFLAGLFRFINTLRRPSLALLYALPYFIIIVAMGYTRQAISLGIFMYVIPNLYRKQTVKFVCGVVIASLFHASAIVLIALPVLVVRGKSWKRFYFLPIAVVLVMTLLYVTPVLGLIQRYVMEDEFVSKGAQLRLFVSSIISLTLIFAVKLLRIQNEEKATLVFLAYVSPILFIATFAGLSTTLADRLALYSYPAHLAFFSVIPNILKNDKFNKRFWLLITVIVAIALFVLWIMFTVYLDYWVPYKNYIVCPNECL